MVNKELEEDDLIDKAAKDMVTLFEEAMVILTEEVLSCL